MKPNPTGPEVLPRHEDTGGRRFVPRPAVRAETSLAPADHWVELKWAEGHMTVRDAKGQPRNYVAAAALPEARCPVPRVCHAKQAGLEADPALRVSPPATLVMPDR
jgi:hypothetical protein